MYFMSDPQALHVTRNVIPGKLGVDLHLHRVHIPLVVVGIVVVRCDTLLATVVTPAGTVVVIVVTTPANMNIVALMAVSIALLLPSMFSSSSSSSSSFYILYQSTRSTENAIKNKMNKKERR